MKVKIAVRDLSFYYGVKKVLCDISLEIPQAGIACISGPAGSGKSTLLRTLNRMNDAVPDHRLEGSVLLDGEDIYAKEFDPIELRRRVGMVFWRSRFNSSTVFEELAKLATVSGAKNQSEIKMKVEDSLLQAKLWDELSARLEENPTALSALEKKKLCVARTIIQEPEVILLDEPFDDLDAADEARMKELALSIKENYTVVMTSQSAMRAAKGDYSFILEAGKLKPV